MLKFKRIKALLLALILSLSLTACSEEVTSAIVDEVIDIAVSEVVDVLTEDSGETADVESPPAQEEHYKQTIKRFDTTQDGRGNKKAPGGAVDRNDFSNLVFGGIFWNASVGDLVGNDS